MKPFRFALQGRNFAERDAVIAMARQAEALGYEELYSADHIGAADPFAPAVPTKTAPARRPASNAVTRPFVNGFISLSP